MYLSGCNYYKILVWQKYEYMFNVHNKYILCFIITIYDNYFSALNLVNSPKTTFVTLAGLATGWSIRFCGWPVQTLSTVKRDSSVQS